MSGGFDVLVHVLHLCRLHKVDWGRARAQRNCAGGLAVVEYKEGERKRDLQNKSIILDNNLIY